MSGRSIQPEPVDADDDSSLMSLSGAEAASRLEQLLSDAARSHALHAGRLRAAAASCAWRTPLGFCVDGEQERRMGELARHMETTPEAFAMATPMALELRMRMSARRNV